MERIIIKREPLNRFEKMIWNTGLFRILPNGKKQIEIIPKSISLSCLHSIATKVNSIKEVPIKPENLLQGILLFPGFKDKIISIIATASTQKYEEAFIWLGKYISNDDLVTALQVLISKCEKEYFLESLSAIRTINHDQD